MLLTSYIRESKADVILGLKKKKFPEAEATVGKILQLDQRKKEAQRQHDQILFEFNG